MSTREAAKYLGISYYYLRNLRHCMHNDPGPEYTEKRYLRGEGYSYTKEALDAWAKSRVWRKPRTAKV